MLHNIVLHIQWMQIFIDQNADDLYCTIPKSIITTDSVSVCYQTFVISTFDTEKISRNIFQKHENLIQYNFNFKFQIYQFE